MKTHINEGCFTIQIRGVRAPVQTVRKSVHPNKGVLNQQCQSTLGQLMLSPFLAHPVPRRAPQDAVLAADLVRCSHSSSRLSTEDVWKKHGQCI